MNLLHNAIKFSPDGGTVTITTRRAARRRGRLGDRPRAWASRRRTRTASSSASTRSTGRDSAASAAPAWAWPSPDTSPRRTADASGSNRPRARAPRSASPCPSPERPGVADRRLGRSGCYSSSRSGGTSQRSVPSPSPSVVVQVDGGQGALLHRACRPRRSGRPAASSEIGVVAHQHGLAGAQLVEQTPELPLAEAVSPGRASTRTVMSSSAATISAVCERAHLGAADDDVRPDAMLVQEAAQPLRTACGPCCVRGRRSSSPSHSMASPAWAWRNRCRRTDRAGLPEPCRGHARKSRTSGGHLPAGRDRAPRPRLSDWRQSVSDACVVRCTVRNRSMRWLMRGEDAAEGAQALLVAALHLATGSS